MVLLHIIKLLVLVSDYYFVGRRVALFHSGHVYVFTSPNPEDAVLDISDGSHFWIWVHLFHIWCMALGKDPCSCFNLGN